MSSSTGDIGVNGNLNVSNTLNSSGLTVNSGTVDFSGAAFVNNCIPSAAINGGTGSSNASTIAVANDASLTITNGYIPYCGVTNTNVALKTNGSLKYNATTGTLTTTINGNASSANTSTTQATSDNSTNIATTAFVQNNISALSSIYATISSLSSYLTTSSASSTFATISSLSNYVSNASPTITSNLTLPTTFTTPTTGQLGFVYSTNPTGTSMNGTKTIATLTLDTGVWIINGQVAMTGANLYGLSISFNTNAVDTSSELQVQGGSSNYFNVTRIYTNTTASKPVYLVVYIGGTAITPSGIYFTAVRIA